MSSILRLSQCQKLGYTRHLKIPLYIQRVIYTLSNQLSGQKCKLMPFFSCEIHFSIYYELCCNLMIKMLFKMGNNKTRLLKLRKYPSLFCGLLHHKNRLENSDCYALSLERKKKIIFTSFFQKCSAILMDFFFT